VHPLNDVSAVVEDAPDVFSVHCAGEMGITIVPSVSTGCMYQKLITYEVLCPCDTRILPWLCVACKLWEILFNFRFPCQHLLYVLEEVEGLLQSVGLIVFPDHHVVAAAGHHKYNGRHIWRDRQGERITTGLDMIQEMFMDYSASQQVLIRTTTGYLLLCTVDQLVLIGSLEADFALCFGSLSCWKTNLRPSLKSFADSIRFSSRMVLYLAPSIFPSILTIFPVPAEEKQAQTMMLPPPCLTMGMVCSG
uniref:Uncharacterized protein n=1 Tax=Oncorhynchus mykiss TaxID=8022 RepID=A0A8C7P234_ONCMY